MNPYIIIAIMLAADAVTLPIIIKGMLKKNRNRKALRITVFLCAFILTEAVFSYIYISSSLFYDRAGNSCTNAENIVYYDSEDRKYTLTKDGNGYMHLISSDGRKSYIAERIYVDDEGYIVFDKNNEFKEADSPHVFRDSKGNRYTSVLNTVWNKNGQKKVIE